MMTTFDIQWYIVKPLSIEDSQNSRICLVALSSYPLEDDLEYQIIYLNSTLDIQRYSSEYFFSRFVSGLLSQLSNDGNQIENILSLIKLEDSKLFYDAKRFTHQAKWFKASSSIKHHHCIFGVSML